MDLLRPEAVGVPATPAGAAPDTESAGRPFGDVIGEMGGTKIRLIPPEVPAPHLQAPAADAAARLRQEKETVAKAPHGIEQLGREIEQGATRLRELVDQLQSGRTYRPQELLAVQAEMGEITLRIEVTTRVVAEAVSGVRTLMHQQA
jgi:hypothetical protein